jgi:hypothetical protein
VDTKSYSVLNEGFSSNLECVFTWINNSKINEFIWHKDGKPINITELNVELTLRGRFLYFKNLSHIIHNGVYRCDIELVTGQVVKSSNSVNLLVSCK